MVDHNVSLRPSRPKPTGHRDFYSTDRDHVTVYRDNVTFSSEIAEPAALGRGVDRDSRVFDPMVVVATAQQHGRRYPYEPFLTQAHLFAERDIGKRVHHITGHDHKTEVLCVRRHPVEPGFVQVKIRYVQYAHGQFGTVRATG